jgi:hypothetical protein
MTASLVRYPVQPSLDLSYLPLLCESSSVAEGSALVQGSVDSSVALPSAGEVGGFIGLALFAGPANATSTMQVVTSGFYLAVASGTITRGDRLVIADSTGKLKTWTANVADLASVCAIAMESVTTGQRVNVKILGGQVSASPQSLIKAFVAGTGGSTAGCAMVQDSTAGQAVLAAGADPTAGVLGLALNTAIATATVYVCMYGVCPGKAAAAGFTIGKDLAVSANTGVLKDAAPTAGVNTMIVGMALETATSGQLKNVFVRPQTLQGAGLA